MPSLTPVSANQYWNPTISKERQSSVREALNELKFESAGAVLAARQAITDMGWLDTLCDRLFSGGAKQRALEGIATKVLCEKALAFLEHSDRTLNDDVLEAIVGGKVDSGADQVQVVMYALDRAQCRLIDLFSAAGREMFETRAIVRSDGKTIEFAPVGSAEAHELLTLRWHLDESDQRRVLNLDDPKAELRKGWLSELRISSSLRSAMRHGDADADGAPAIDPAGDIVVSSALLEDVPAGRRAELVAAADNDGAVFLVHALKAGRSATIAAYGSLLTLVPPEERDILVAARDAYGRPGLSEALKHLSKSQQESTVRAYGDLLRLLPRNDRAALLAEIQQGHDDKVMPLYRLRSLLGYPLENDRDNPAHNVAITDVRLSTQRVSQRISEALNLPVDPADDGDGNFRVILEKEKQYQLRAALEIPFSKLEVTCSKWAKEAIHAGVQIIPVGIKERGFPLENHEVTLLCAPGMKPIIIDSKAGGTYPSSIDVIVTGRQSIFDRSSCGSHTVQQCVHYAYMLDKGVPFNRVRPYDGAPTSF